MEDAVNDKAKQALVRLGSLPGMAEVKEQVEQMVYLSRVAKRRKEMSLKSSPQSLHMIFTGSPGTGKTTAARLIGEAFVGMGLLKSRGDIPFVEVRQDEVAHPHVGQGEKNMVNKFKEARGGVLFLDEAYSFVGKSEHRSAEKIVAAIVQCMEDMRDEVLVIAAGYEKEMQSFISFNPGLNSRFPTRISFPDYTVPELIRIGEQMAADQDYTLSDDYKDALTGVLWVEKSRPHFGNARTVRNHIERSIRRQAVRLSSLTSVKRNDLMLLTGSDLVASVTGMKAAEKEALSQIISEAQTRLNELELRKLLSG